METEQAALTRMKRLQDKGMEGHPDCPKNNCPRCGGSIVRDDRVGYTETGELDQHVFWVCLGCGMEW